MKVCNFVHDNRYFTLYHLYTIAMFTLLIVYHDRILTTALDVASLIFYNEIKQQAVSTAPVPSHNAVC